MSTSSTLTQAKDGGGKEDCFSKVRLEAYRELFS
jgi:hypothetical protein